MSIWKQETKSSGTSLKLLRSILKEKYVLELKDNLNEKYALASKEDFNTVIDEDGFLRVDYSKLINI